MKKAAAILTGAITVFPLLVSASQILNYDKSSAQLVAMAEFLIGLDAEIGNGDAGNVDHITVILQSSPPATRDPRTNPKKGDSLTAKWSEYNEDGGYCYTYTEKLTYSGTRWESIASSSKRGQQLVNSETSQEERGGIEKFGDKDC